MKPGNCPRLIFFFALLATFAVRASSSSSSRRICHDSTEGAVQVVPLLRGEKVKLICQHCQAPDELFGSVLWFQTLLHGANPLSWTQLSSTDKSAPSFVTFGGHDRREVAPALVQCRLLNGTVVSSFLLEAGKNEKHHRSKHSKSHVSDNIPTYFGANGDTWTAKCQAKKGLKSGVEWWKEGELLTKPLTRLRAKECQVHCSCGSLFVSPRTGDLTIGHMMKQAEGKYTCAADHGHTWSFHLKVKGHDRCHVSTVFLVLAAIFVLVLIGSVTFAYCMFRCENASRAARSSQRPVLKQFRTQGDARTFPGRPQHLNNHQFVQIPNLVLPLESRQCSPVGQLQPAGLQTSQKKVAAPETPGIPGDTLEKGILPAAPLMREHRVTL